MAILYSYQNHLDWDKTTVQTWKECILCDVTWPVRLQSAAKCHDVEAHGGCEWMSDAKMAEDRSLLLKHASEDTVCEEQVLSVCVWSSQVIDWPLHCDYWEDSAQGSVILCWNFLCEARDLLPSSAQLNVRMDKKRDSEQGPASYTWRAKSRQTLVLEIKRYWSTVTLVGHVLSVACVWLCLWRLLCYSCGVKKLNRDCMVTKLERFAIWSFIGQFCIALDWGERWGQPSSSLSRSRVPSTNSVRAFIVYGVSKLNMCTHQTRVDSPVMMVSSSAVSWVCLRTKHSTNNLDFQVGNICLLKGWGIFFFFWVFSFLVLCFQPWYICLHSTHSWYITNLNNDMKSQK